jgi:hypothetical protein
VEDPGAGTWWAEVVAGFRLKTGRGLRWMNILAAWEVGRQGALGPDTSGVEDDGVAAGSGVDASVRLVERLAPGGEGTGAEDRRAGDGRAAIGEKMLCCCCCCCCCCSTIPIYLPIAMNTPKWVIKAIDKIRRGFIWKGRKEANGGSCLVSWETVTKPISLGGLGITNLQFKNWPLQAKWCGLKKLTQIDHGRV